MDDLTAELQARVAVAEARLKILESRVKGIDQRTWAVLVTNLVAVGGIVALLVKG